MQRIIHVRTVADGDNIAVSGLITVWSTRATYNDNIIMIADVHSMSLHKPHFPSLECVPYLYDCIKLHIRLFSYFICTLY